MWGGVGEEWEELEEGREGDLGSECKIKKIVLNKN